MWAGAFRPGRMHDQTAVKTEGISDLFTRFPQVNAKADAGYRGLAKDFPDQVQAPPLTPGKDAPPEETAAQEGRNNATSSHRNGSAAGTPTPNSSSGALSSATSDEEKTSTKPS